MEEIKTKAIEIITDLVEEICHIERDTFIDRGWCPFSYYGYKIPQGRCEMDCDECQFDFFEDIKKHRLEKELKKLD